MRIVAIIPAYNEAATIADVVRIARSHPRIAEVIVVDDGSRDQTAAAAERAGARIIRLEHNRGKAEAMKTGVGAAKHATHFMFLDADLVGLKKEHIEALIDGTEAKLPAGRTEAKLPVGSLASEPTPRSLASDPSRSLASFANAMTVGIRDRGAMLTALNRCCLPWISGERLVSRALWEAVPPEFKHGFKIELALNATARKLGYEILPVLLPGLSIRRKEQKVGVIAGLWQRAKMAAELIATMVRIVLQ